MRFAAFLLLIASSAAAQPTVGEEVIWRVTSPETPYQSGRASLFGASFAPFTLSTRSPSMSFKAPPPLIAWDGTRVIEFEPPPRGRGRTVR